MRTPTSTSSSAVGTAPPVRLRIGGFEDAHHEVAYGQGGARLRFGTCGGGSGQVALLPCLLCLPQGSRQAQQQRQCHQARHSHRQTVATQETQAALAESRGACRHHPLRTGGIDVLHHRLDRAVTPRWILGQRLACDRFQIRQPTP